MGAQSRIIRILLSVGLCVLAGLGQSPYAQTMHVSPIVLTGTTAPGTAGGVFSGFGQVSINDSGALAHVCHKRL